MRRKYIYPCLAIISFLMLYGTVGGMENERLGLIPGVAISMVCLISMATFGYLSQIRKGALRSGNSIKAHR